MNPLIGWTWWSLVALGSDGQELGRMDRLMRAECEHAVYWKAGRGAIGTSGLQGLSSIAFTATDTKGRRVTFTCQPEVQQ